MAQILLIAVLPCALSGCWEEIHYSPPPPGSAPVAVVPDATVDQTTDEQAGDFGDDVANSLAEEPLPSAAEAVPPIAEAPPPIDTSELPPVEASEEGATQATSAANSRRAAWSLGSTLSLAALANDRAAGEDKVTAWFETARQQAAALGTKVADLPPRPAAADVDLEGKRAMDYLFSQGQVIGPQLAATFGDDHNALFEVALKSNILLVRYQPDAPIAKLLAAGVSQASERAKLPPELVEPVLKLVEAGAPVKEVRDAVFDMHTQVDQYLAPATP